jgi:hypothetical protein
MVSTVHSSKLSSEYCELLVVVSEANCEAAAEAAGSEWGAAGT